MSRDLTLFSLLLLGLTACGGSSTGTTTSKSSLPTTTKPSVTAPQASDVELSFHWEPGTTAKVHRKETETKDGVTRVVEGRSRMRVSRLSSGLLIHHDRAEIIQADLPPGPIGEAFREVLNMDVTTVVNQDGQVIGLHGHKQMLDKILLGLDNALGDVPAEHQAMADQVLTNFKQMVSEQAVLQMAATEWNARVATWISEGRRLQIGVPYEYDFSAPHPFAPGSEVKMHMVFQVAQWVACPGDRAQACVRIQAETTADSESLNGAVRIAIAALAADTKIKKPRQLDVDGSVEIFVELVTEPATLLPHSFAERKVVQMTITQDGEVSSSNKDELTEEIFTYPYE